MANKVEGVHLYEVDTTIPYSRVTVWNKLKWGTR